MFISLSLQKKETSFFVLPSTFRNFADMKKAIVMGASSGMGYDVAKLLLKDGWQVGVAARRMDMLEQLKEQGVYFQCNVLSLDGFYGEVAQRKAFEFIENGWVEFLGTDMHNVEYALALRHASTNKKIIKLMETTDFENKNLAVI